MRLTLRGDWEWVPGESIGPISFGDRAERHVASLELEEQERDFDGRDEWVRYWSSTGDLSVLAINGRITSVRCERSFIYRGRNLIGLSEGDLRRALADARYQVSIDSFGHSLGYEELGLDVEIIDGYVSSVTATADPDSVL